MYTLKVIDNTTGSQEVYPVIGKLDYYTIKSTELEHERKEQVGTMLNAMHAEFENVPLSNDPSDTMAAMFAYALSIVADIWRVEGMIRFNTAGDNPETVTPICLVLLSGNNKSYYLVNSNNTTVASYHNFDYTTDNICIPMRDVFGDGMWCNYCAGKISKEEMIAKLNL